ncbi:antitermination protein [Roseibium limicola]|uniref:Antitermination protein n=1 Tax=Roseibium limicola TaxID=2816037 RepID=A0A939J851_9HYPH|nr:antitermination protein [Roseibium limicola]MBO0344946.1 antitermination protein [Roseibium limicola]
MQTITVAALFIAIAGLFYTVFLDKAAPELSRFECENITLFAPQGQKSATDHCATYGGLAQDSQLKGEALVILVRNQPVGGFEGREYTIR